MKKEYPVFFDSIDKTYSVNLDDLTRTELEAVTAFVSRQFGVTFRTPER